MCAMAQPLERGVVRYCPMAEFVWFVLKWGALLIGAYVVVRLVSAAYFQSKIDYEERKKNHAER